MCQPQLRKSPYEESPDNPFLDDFSVYKRVIVTMTTLSTTVDVQLNLVTTTDAEFETHRVGFSNYIRFQYIYKRIIVTCYDETVHPPPTSAINWINICLLLEQKINRDNALQQINAQTKTR